MAENFAELSQRKGKRALLLAMMVLLAGVAAGYFFVAHENMTRHEDSSGGGQLWTCGMHPQVIQNKPGNCPICGMALEPVRDQKISADGGAAVRIDPVIVQNMGVRVAKVAVGPLEQSIRAVGYLNWAEPNIYDVNLRVSGWVDKLYANTEGMAVAEGQPLFELYSPEIQVAAGELIAARRAASRSPDHGVSQALFDTARRKLEQWGVGASQIERLSRMESAPRAITFVSPVSGELVEKNLVNGAAAMMGQRALRIANRDPLWLDSQIYAMDVPAVKLGQRVTASVEGLPGREFSGEVIFIDPRIDPNTRTAKVRVALPNKDLVLKPGMFARVLIKTRIADDAMLVPREAMIDTGERQVVFVALDEGRFEPREVKPGASGEGGVVQVLSGLSPSDSVVISGQFLLDAESRMKEAIQKHLSGKLAAPAYRDPAHQHAPARSAVEPEVSVEFSEALDNVVRNYLNLSHSFGEVQTSTERADFAPLISSAEALRDTAEGTEQQAAVAQLLDTVRPLAAVSQDEQRSGLKTVSNAVLRIVEQWPPSRRVAGDDGKLFVFYCPMADGYWLQDTGDKPANPYFAKEMKACAEVKRAIEASPENGRD